MRARMIEQANASASAAPPPETGAVAPVRARAAQQGVVEVPATQTAISADEVLSQFISFG